jgi:hypothetical protein
VFRIASLLLASALAFVVVLFRDLQARRRIAVNRETQFLCRTALLALTGFIVSGLFDYTYGHSLGLWKLTLLICNSTAGTSSALGFGLWPVLSLAANGETEQAKATKVAIPNLCLRVSMTCFCPPAPV